MTISKRVLRPVLLCWLALSLLGCSEPQHDSIRLAVANAPTQLDPRYATDAVSTRLCRLLYRSLVDFNERFEPVPQLASWQQLSERHYRFTLLAGRRVFSNGQPLSSADVAATYQSILDPKTASPQRASLAMIERIDTPDDSSIDFYLNREDPLFAGRHVIGILPAALLASGHPFNRTPLGSGPIVLTQRNSESELEFSRRDDGQALELLVIKDASVRALKLARGEVDLLAGDLPPELQGWIEQRQGLQVERAQGNTFSYLGFNLKDADSGRLVVRQAIAHAIDRGAIIRYLLHGSARLAAGMLPPEHWAGPEQAGITYAPETARELLATAGYSEQQPLRLTYKTSTNPFRLRLASVIQQQLAEVGIEVAIESHDWGSFYGDIKAGRFQIYSLSWVGLKLPDIFRYVFHSESLPPRGANRGRYADPRVDALIAASEQVPMNAQIPIYQALYQRLQETLPYVPLWYEDQVLARRADIRGYTLSADGNYDGLMSVTRER